MSMDMSQFHGVFIEESQEHLDEMEHLLLALDPSSPDIEELNSIFRAAHSIKGGSGMFSFDALITVTHVMESLFDKARQGKFNFSVHIIDELLMAVDTLRKLLKSYADSTEIEWALVNSTTASLEVILEPDSHAESQDDENGFGFFKPLNSSSKSNTSEIMAQVNDDTDDGFGFFEPIVDESTADIEDGFGFFVDLDDNLPDSNSSIQKVSNDEEPELEASVLHDTTDDSITSVSSLAQHAKSTSLSKSNKDTKAKAEASESSSIRVDIAKIDSLVNLVGELVITQSMLNLIGDEITGLASEKLRSALAELERNTRELQEGIMSIRMLPMSFVFNRFPRVVRDLSKKLNKKIDLTIVGGQTEIDKGLIELLVDPLTHLVRNSLDHGIELPEIRIANGKPETGVLTLKAEQKGGNILISVLDDGAGLNRDRILAKAFENNVDVPENPTDQQVWQLIMSAGFSTAEQVTDVSGRGVGMDVVKRNIESMGGRLEILSEKGRGSSFQIRLPLTLAILDGMSISVGGQIFIIPLVNIIESVQPKSSQLKFIGNEQVLDLRDAYWPIVNLYQVMDLEPQSRLATEGILVLVETNNTRFALLVDELIGQQQAVIKSLEQHYRRVQGVAGATIMGDGSVALILDAESLALKINESLKQRVKYDN
ncbi:chemotaxis protein CheA [Shewanella glacialimarina]|uniref:chemotaxis protein CheA n=1 Tax=Shewanella glacialimarina TaxID=2590884 RepID=UPI001CF7F9B7|nr:chemotaxis protein CheW [Shewanella glacialimarina]UCX04552.1 chemotaxis protein CheA [Shewanella glacialimarina]